MATRIDRTDNERFEPIAGQWDDLPALHKRLQTLLKQYLPGSTAGLFAAPEASADGAYTEWYTEFGGQPVRFSELDVNAQRNVESMLRNQDAAIRRMVKALPDGDTDGLSDKSLVEGALNFPGLDTLFVMDGQPVLTLWGHKGDGLPPMHISDLAPPVVAPVAAAVTADNKKKRGGLWLFLLLLVLLGAFLGWAHHTNCRYLPFVIPHICEDIPPLDIDLASVDNVDVRTQHMSDIIKISNIRGDADISVSGDDSMQYRICSDGTTPDTCDATMRVDWATDDNIIMRHEYMQLRATSADDGEKKTTGTVAIDDVTADWGLTTAPENGQCGDAHKQSYITQEELEAATPCASDTAARDVSIIDGAWRWVCPQDTPAGDPAECKAAITAVDGECGDAHEGTFDTIDILNGRSLCASSATSTPVAENGGQWSWTCPAGTESGTDAACKATMTPIDGACGPANGLTVVQSAALTEAGLCTSPATDVAVEQGNNGWSWTCPAGTPNGSVAQCKATLQAINGECGAAHKKTFKEEAEVKTAGLCTSSGAAAGFVKKGKEWRWTCPAETSTGAVGSCKAYVKAPPPPPAPPAQSEFDRRVNREGGAAGNLQVTLIWEDQNDLDLYVVCPNGKTVYFRNRNGCNGKLDVDANMQGGRFSRSPVENVTWTGAVPPGTYKVYVENYLMRAGNPQTTNFKVRVRKNGQDTLKRGSVKAPSLFAKDKRHVITFSVP